jgi:hypothetical protein
MIQVGSLQATQKLGYAGSARHQGSGTNCSKLGVKSTSLATGPTAASRCDRSNQAMRMHGIKHAALGLTFMLAAAAPLRLAMVWVHSGAWGGHGWGGADAFHYTGPRGSTASGAGGSWNASGFRGGSASGGGGSWSGTSYRGGTASGSEGSWHATGADGTITTPAAITPDTIRRQW